MDARRFIVKVLGTPVKMAVDEALAAEATVTFRIEAQPGFHGRWTIARTLRGEPLLCAMRLEHVGPVQISVSDPWLKQHVSNLRNDLVDLALRQLEIYPPVPIGARETTML